MSSSSMSTIAWRVAIHMFSGGILLVTMGLSYYSITPFVSDSSQTDAPASLLGWCMFTPTFLIMGYLANMQMLTDPMLPSPIKIFFLVIELALDLTIIGIVGRNPVFDCGITQCTFDNLVPKYEDEITSTWHAESSEGALSLFYFFMGIAFLPFFLYQIWVQGRVMFKFKSTMEVTKKRELQRYKEKYPDAHNFGSVQDEEAVASEELQRESTIEMMENPMLEQQDRSRISMLRNHHKALHKKNLKSLAFEEENKRQWELVGQAAVESHEVETLRKLYTTWGKVFLTLGFLFPLNLFCTSRFGNDFQWYSNYGIAAWAKHQIEPPIPQITISDNLNYKFFPQIIIFYVFLYLVVFIGVCARFIPKIRRGMEWRPRMLKSLGLTFGETLFGFSVVAFTFITFCYVFFDWYADPHVKWLGSTVSERWGRCLGQTALFPMGVMILPVSRNSIWSTVLNYPSEEMLKFHKFSAVMFLVLAFGHLFAFMGVFASLGEFPAAMMNSPNSYRKEDSTIGMMSGVVFFIIVPVFCILTMNVVRRRYFELFYYTHFASGIVFLAIIWHSDFAWMYIAPGLTLYLVDVFLRFNKQVRPMRIMELEPLEDDITKITFAVLSNPGYRRSRTLRGGPAQKGEIMFAPEGIHFEMGQYIYLTLPSISNIQSHPFNIASSTFDEYTTCYIKSQGENSYTGQLLAFAKHLKDPASTELSLKYLPIHVDGPYGLPFDYQAYNSLLFVAGGIGITPLHCILRSLLQLLKTGKGLSSQRLKKVRLVWSFKNPDMIFDNQHIEDTLRMIPPTNTYYNALLKKQRDSEKSNKGARKAGKGLVKTNEGKSDSGELDDVKAMMENSNAHSTDDIGKDDAAAIMSEYPTIDGDIVFEVSLHCTSGSKGPSHGIGVKRAKAKMSSLWHPIIPHRCDIRNEVKELSGNKNALVYCVGPQPLIKEATDACSDYGVRFRGETAEF